MLHGLNVDPLTGVMPGDARGYQFVRMPLWQDVQQETYEEFIRGAVAAHLSIMVVMDKRTLSRPLHTSYVDRMTRLRALYPQIDYWQVGNEPDQPGSPSSWAMKPGTYRALLHAASAVFHDKYLLAAGLVSGNPAWLREVGRLPIEGVAIHPYGQRPDWWVDPDWGFGKATDLLDMYRTVPQVRGKDLWCTEYGGEEALFEDHIQRELYYRTMAQTLSQYGVYGAAAFCKCEVPGFDMDFSIA